MKSKLLNLSLCIFVILTQISTLFVYSHVGKGNSSKLTIYYPNYAGLDSESYEIIPNKQLNDYIKIGENKLESLFGIKPESIRVIVNGFELEKEELSYSVENFMVSENEGIRVEIDIKTSGPSEEIVKETGIENVEEVENERKGLANSESREGILILRFIFKDQERGVISEKVPASTTVKRMFPVSNGDLITLVSEFASPMEFSLESISTSKNREVNLLENINENNIESNSGIESGDMLFIKLRAEEGTNRVIPVRMVFSNRNIQSLVLKFKDNASMGDLLNDMLQIKDPETGMNLMESHDNILIQNEEGMTVDTDRHAMLKDQIPASSVISEERPLVLYVTVLSSNVTEFNHIEDLKQEQSNNENLNEMSDVFDSNEANETGREQEEEVEVGFPEIHFIHEDTGFEVKLRNDPTFTTIASLYSQAQLIWSIVTLGSKEKNCLLVFKGRNMEEKILDPNKHETLITLNDYSNGIKLVLRTPQTRKITVKIYINKGEGELGFLKKLRMSVPEVISVRDFLREAKRHGSELSRYLITGLQRKLDGNNLVEYLSDPRTPSSVTYLTFMEKTNDNENVFLEVERARKIDVLLLLPSKALGRDIMDSIEEDSLRGEMVVEYRFTVLSNSTVRDLVKSLLRRKILKRVSPNNVFLLDRNTKEYLKNDYILGHHNSLSVGNEKGDSGRGRKGGKHGKGKMVFEVSILNYMELSLSFYYPQGEEYSEEKLEIKIKQNKTVRELKELIAAKGEEKGILSRNLSIGIGSGYDIGGDEFKKVVYSILGDNTRLEDSGLTTKDSDVRVYVLKDKEMDKESVDNIIETNNEWKESGQQKEPQISVLERVSKFGGTFMEVPLSLSNCPLNTLLERRWFVVPFTLEIPIGELKILVDEVAMLNGAEFDLFAETDKGKLELNQVLESCSSLGVTEVGLFSAVCKQQSGSGPNKSDAEKPLIQAIMEDSCVLGGSKEECELAKDVEEEIASNSSGLEGKGEEGEEGGLRESLELLGKIDRQIKWLEEKELSVKKNRKIMERLKKRDELSYKRNLLREDEVERLLDEFVRTYIAKGARGLNRFCRKQGSEKIEQLIVYLSTSEGKQKLKEIAREERDSLKTRRGAARNKRQTGGTGLDEEDILSDVEHSILPKLAQFSEYDSSSEESYFDEETRIGRSSGSSRRNKGRRRGLSGSSMKAYYSGNRDLEPVTLVESGKKRGSIVSRIFSRTPLLSPTISFLYSRFTKKGRRKRRDSKKIRHIMDLEIKFRKKAYGGGVDENEDLAASGFDS